MGSRRRITISVQEQVERWLRVKAAQEGKSLSQTVEAMLRLLMFDDGNYERAMKDYFAQRPITLHRRGNYPSRDQRNTRRA